MEQHSTIESLIKNYNDFLEKRRLRKQHKNTPYLIKKATIETLPEEIDKSYLLIAHKKRSGRNKYGKKIDFLLYRIKTNEKKQYYDFLVLTGENAKTIYTDVTPENMMEHGINEIYNKSLSLDIYDIKNLEICGTDNHLEQKISDCVFEMTVKQDFYYLDTLKTDYLVYLAEQVNMVKENKKPKSDLNEQTWKNIDSQLIRTKKTKIQP